VTVLFRSCSTTVCVSTTRYHDMPFILFKISNDANVVKQKKCCAKVCTDRFVHTFLVHTLARHRALSRNLLAPKELFLLNFWKGRHCWAVAGLCWPGCTSMVHGLARGSRQLGSHSQPASTVPFPVLARQLFS
jgi:hypothetical protein